MPDRVYIGLGSNLGDRQGYLEAGLADLAAVPGVQFGAISSVYETAPQGFADQPFFFNAAIAVGTTLSPPDLLQIMQQIEERHHRQRTIHWGPRTLDLDLLLYGECRIDTPLLVLPHPHLTERCFVLAPLCEIAPALCHPDTGRPLSSYYQQLDCSRQLRCVGPLNHRS